LRDIVEVTQDKLIQKDPENPRRFLDRWELKKVTYGPDIDEKAMGYFQYFGLVDEILPANKEHDFGLVNGGLNGGIGRFGFAVKQWKQGVHFDTLVLLGSKRELKRDGEVDEIKNFLDPNYFGLPVREGWEQPEELPTTEFELMHAVFDKIDMPEDMRKHDKLMGIDSEANLHPDGTKTRAITDNNVSDWLKTDPKGTFIAYANNPYILRMGLVLKEKIPDITLLKGEIVGAAADPEFSGLEVYEGEFARLLFQVEKVLDKRKINV
jgi:hypothetical protein